MYACNFGLHKINDLLIKDPSTLMLVRVVLSF